MQRPATTPLVATLTKHVPIVEKIFLAAVAAGALLRWLEMDRNVLIVSLSGLAATHFLMAYRPLEIPRQEGEKQGFIDVLGLMIIPKVLWIGCAVCSSGLAFRAMAINDGFKEMLLIGGTTIGAATFLLGVLSLAGVKHINVVAPVLLRAVPLAGAALYIVFG